MSTYKIEGEWSGYTSSQRHVVHRKYTTDRLLAEQVKKLNFIVFTDGTTLNLRVSESNGGVKEREIDGYSSLIADCLSQNVNTVAALSNAAKVRP